MNARRRRWIAVAVLLLALSVAALTAVTAAVSSGSSASGRLRAVAPRAPLLGVNLIQYRFYAPYCWGNHILLDYHQLAVREEIIPALHAMRAAGVETLRLQLVHMHGTTHWIPSDGGRIHEPYRTNLINLLTDIRHAGFEQVTIQFSPRGPNEPAGWYADDPGPYNPALFDENWGFIRDARTLVKQYGPASSHFDIYNEGAPGDWDLANKPSWGDYVTRLYSSYVDAFGNTDVTISSVAKGMWNFGNTGDDVERLQNLIDLLRSTGRPMPSWFAVHPSWDGRAVDDLRAVDAVLTRNGLSQPLVISETQYENPATAAAVAEFIHTSSRRVLETIEWPLYADNVVGQGFVEQSRCPALPYRVTAYAEALRGGPPARALRGSVSPNGQFALLTAYGDPVKAVVADTYTVTIHDNSAKHSFRFTTRATGLRFRGNVTWTIKLRAGRYSYAAKGPRTVTRMFQVMNPGG